MYNKLIGPNAVFSHSRLSKFYSCPAAFKMRYVDGIEGREGIERFLGKKFHETVQFIYDHKKETGDHPTLPQTREHFRTLFEIGRRQDIAIVAIDKSFDDYLKMGINFLNNFYIDKYPFEEKDIEVEQKIAGKIGPYNFQAIIDLKHEDSEFLYIDDYKTSSNVLTKTEMKFDLQGLIYTILAGQFYKSRKTIKRRWINVREMKTLEGVATQDQIDITKERVLKVVKDIEESFDIDHFPYRLNFFCDWCEFNQNCETFKNNIMKEK